MAEPRVFEYGHIVFVRKGKKLVWGKIRQCITDPASGRLYRLYRGRKFLTERSLIHPNDGYTIRELQPGERVRFRPGFSERWGSEYWSHVPWDLLPENKEFQTINPELLKDEWTVYSRNPSAYFPPSARWNNLRAAVYVCHPSAGEGSPLLVFFSDLDLGEHTPPPEPERIVKIKPPLDPFACKMKVRVRL